MRQEDDKNVTKKEAELYDLTGDDDSTEGKEKKTIEVEDNKSNMS